MRFAVLIIILLFLPVNGVNSQNNFAMPQDAQDNNNEIEKNIDADTDSGFDDDLLLLQPDIFSQKKFQKRLKSLSEKDKVIWAFKLAKRDIFL